MFWGTFAQGQFTDPEEATEKLSSASDTLKR